MFAEKEPITPRLCHVLQCEKPRWAKGYCSTHYQRFKATGDPLKTPGAKFDPADILRRRTAFYWNNVDKRGPDECWPWLRTLSRGYGQLRWVSGQMPAHRVGWELAHGPIPDEPADLTVDHTCLNRACQNPGHMRLLTRAENVIDGIERRHARNGTSPRIVSTRVCCVDECEKLVTSFDRCVMHYQRMRRGSKLPY